MTAYCVFDVGTRRIGLEMAHIREIIERDSILPVSVPLAPGFMLGLFNLRGQVLPLLDLASFIGTTAIGPAKADRAVVVARGDFRFATCGVRIDTLEVDPAAFPILIYPAPSTSTHPLGK